MIGELRGWAHRTGDDEFEDVIPARPCHTCEGQGEVPGQFYSDTAKHRSSIVGCLGEYMTHRPVHGPYTYRDRESFSFLRTQNRPANLKSGSSLPSSCQPSFLKQCRLHPGVNFSRSMPFFENVLL